MLVEFRNYLGTHLDLLKFNNQVTKLGLCSTESKYINFHNDFNSQNIWKCADIASLLHKVLTDSESLQFRVKLSLGYNPYSQSPKKKKKATSDIWMEKEIDKGEGYLPFLLLLKNNQDCLDVLLGLTKF